MKMRMNTNMSMSNEGAVSAIIVAAGKGSRTGLGFNKVLADLGGVPMLQRTIHAFIDSGLIDEIILVISRDDEERVRKIIQKPHGILNGPMEEESARNRFITGLRRCQGNQVLY